MSRAEQFLFGYDDGHRLLAGSCSLPGSKLVALLGATDAPMSPGCPPLVTGLALPDSHEFCFCVTWIAAEQQRSGAVWAHALIVDAETLEDPTALEALFGVPVRPAMPGPDLAAYEEPIELDACYAASYLPDAPPSAELLERLARAASSEHGDRVFLHEDLGEAASAVIAVWAAQRPDLRARFSFRTREAARLERSEYVLTVAAKASGQNAFTPAEQAVPTPTLLSELIHEVNTRRPEVLGDFLWEYGHGEAAERRPMRLPARTLEPVAYAAQAGVEAARASAPAQADSALERGKAETLPLARERRLARRRLKSAAALKRALFTQEREHWWAAKRPRIGRSRPKPRLDEEE